MRRKLKFIIAIHSKKYCIYNCCRGSSEISEQKQDYPEKSDVLDRLLKSAGLDKESHKANFATFMNVIVSQR